MPRPHAIRLPSVLIPAIITGAALTAMTSGALAALSLPHILEIPNPVPKAGAAFGSSVAGIGDVNGDGVGDLVVGAPGADKVFVLSGADRTLIRAIADPDGLTGLRFGFAVRGVGDVNGDGVEDIGVGAPGAEMFLPLPCVDPNQPCLPDPAQGRAFVFSGLTGGLLRRLLPPGAEFLVFGVSIEPIGDLTGDGIPEIAVGSPTHLNNKFGQVFAFSGSDGSLFWKSVEPGTEALASFGSTLSSIDDVDGDGHRDLLVSAPFHDADPDPAVDVLAGRAYLLSGLDGTVLRVHDDPSPANGHDFGLGMTGLPDETGDGVEEYALGSPGAGKVFVFNGATGATLRSISSPGKGATDFFGFPLARVDDENGDGREDLWVSASRGGAIHLMTSTGTLLSTVSDPTPGAPAPGGGFGASLSATADLGGDGKRDLIAGEPAADQGAAAMAGAAYVVVNDRPPVARCRSITRAADDACVAAVDPAEIDDGSFDPDGDSLTFSIHPSGPFFLGTTPVVLTVSDGRGASSTCSASVTVADVSPPMIALVSADPAALWPPNHRLIGVDVAYQVLDNCSSPAAIVCVLGVVSSEPSDGKGDGNTTPDFLVVDPHHLRLRAERSGGGPGRVYAIGITCSDASGNSASQEVSVTVAHDQGRSAGRRHPRK
jgi:hypothetical protein